MPTNRTATPSNVDYSPITQAMIDQSQKDEEALRLRRKKQADNRKRAELDGQISSTETDIATFNSHEKLAKAAYDKAINEITKNRSSATKRLEDLKSKRSALGKPEEVETDPDDEEPAPTPKSTASPVAEPQAIPIPKAEPKPQAPAPAKVAEPKVEEKPEAEPQTTPPGVIVTAEPVTVVQPSVREAPQVVAESDGLTTAFPGVPQTTRPVRTSTPKKAKVSSDQKITDRYRKVNHWFKENFQFHKDFILDIVERVQRPMKVKYIVIVAIVLIVAIVMAIYSFNAGHVLTALIAFIVIAALGFILAKRAVTPVS